MSIDLAVLADVLKTQYAPKLNDLFKIDNAMYNFFAKHEAAIRGDGLIMPAKITPDPSGGPRSGTGAIPKAGAPSFDRFRIWGTYYSRRFLVWDEAQDYADGAGSYVSALQDAIADGIEWMKHMLARDMFWGRQMGIATVEATGHVAQRLDLTNTYGLYGGGPSLLGEARGTRYLVKGMHFNIIDATAPGNPGTKRIEGTSNATEFVITDITAIDRIAYESIDPTTGVQAVVADTIGGLADGDIVVPVDSFNNPAANTQSDPIGFQTYGLDEIISDGTDVDSIMYGDYGNLNRSVVTETASLVQNVGGPLTTNPDLIRRMARAITAKSGKDFQSGGEMICHDSLLEVMPAFVSGGTQYQPQSAPLGMPDSAITWNLGNGSKQFRTSNLCPSGTIFFVNRNYMNRFEVRPIGFDTNGGGMLKNYSTGGQDYPAVTGWLNWGGQIFSPVPNAHGKMVNITGTDDLYGFSGAHPSGFVYLR